MPQAMQNRSLIEHTLARLDVSIPSNANRIFMPHRLAIAVPYMTLKCVHFN